MLHTLMNADPLTASWMLVLATLFLVAVALPIVRALLAGILYAIAGVTGNRQLRNTAHTVMPRIGHLIGGIALGIVSVAAPAMAASDEPSSLSHVNLDRDAGASTTPRVETSPTPKSIPATVAPSHANTNVAPATATPASPSNQVVYIVKAGDTLWDIAQDHLDNPSDAQTTETWKAIWKANRTTIGEHPELITPGQILYLDSALA